ncbi:ankyrin repeat and zinc finger domain-containing protein [Histoplasma capsulatum G186AR]|uniref:Ankyrin repeat and zinc finger domain-containing protein n=2 Tax=Ajellomyces capsulatus TaxID=5037 RepID=C0NDY4_AJECG|nr:ankyrin repeat and zinc finger domain-containing protein [Histoplasma capsulatum G186AR]EEH10432.1 ankyrin repeat and zinc finger domain-containing protein [Histoplasma capsulatum G186AR]KAG5290586.1 ankyrin repeat and zinc finger domain-containing protein [Histoplasma capsulatum]QSS72514.1 ankyrin repeat and zinc finger domain-containing protein [Histoplasma capsulatum G186AR]
MALDVHTGQELLKRPLYVFDLPAQLLASLSRKATGAQSPVPPNLDDRHKTLDQAERSDGATGVTTCSLCHVSFQDVHEQRDHVKSDHHRYNLKSRLRGTPVLNEVEFNKAIGELDESISGSESSSDEEEEVEEGQKPPDTTLTALLKKQAKISSTAEAEEIIAKQTRNPGKHPLLWFSSSLLPQATSLGIYRALFTNTEQEETDHLLESLRNKQYKASLYQPNKTSHTSDRTSKLQQPSPHVFLCMIGGGHFAAMIVALAPEIIKKPGGIEERQARVLAHKTFHRYTTRRKQGGSQSAADAAHGAAHSAGASIRRYNEAALQTEIRQLLGSWKEIIDQAQLLFIRATGNMNRRILFGPYDGQVLRSSDSRLRGFPFTTRRATQGELMRAFTELTRVKVSHIDEAALALEAEKPSETMSKSSKPSSQQLQQQQQKLSQEDETMILHSSQIQALIRRSKIPALISYITNNSIPPSFTFHQSSSQQMHHSPTPLHLAASSNSPAIVLALLTKCNSDPTILNGEGKPPFDLAGDRPTRDAFRVARHELGESKWDWDAAHVPPPLSKTEAENRTERERQAAADAEASRRKAEAERLKREDAERALGNRKKAGGQRLLEKTGAEKREEEMRGMTPEMRTRLERERRARAAEERIRRMQAGGGL